MTYRSIAALPVQARALRTLVTASDVRLTRWMARHGVTLLRVSIGIVFLWFGVLKFFPGWSPAQDLAARTIAALTWGAVPGTVSVPLLAALETIIGLGLVTGRFLRATLLLLAAQMAGTVTPLFFFPHETFTRVPIAPTLEGQYIIKNIVLVSAAILIGATVRGGLVIADPAAAREARARTGE
ncbi:MAG TPA: DoxX family membrane protein [Gemmatimonadaceae bacterium]|nr:DoxX family membrane protein [Gemmatimonadaceae bacterium]